MASEDIRADVRIASKAADELDDAAPDLTLWQRGAAAGIASLISSLALNPLDVVKTRMQAHTAHKVLAGSGGPATGSYALHVNSNCAMFTNNMPAYRVPPLQPPPHPQYRSMIHGLLKIARHEGLTSLWRGTDAAVLMTVPLVAVYLPLYDHMLHSLTDSGAGAYAPLVAGATSRGVAGFLTAPLELARVRMQNGGRHGSRNTGNIFSQLSSKPGTTRFQQITSMWTGFGSSLAKDVPFAALYWTLLEPLRGAMMSDDARAMLRRMHLGTGAFEEAPPPPPHPAAPVPPTSLEILVVNIGAAGIAASLAAFVTTPFDVVKTKQQTAKGKAGSIWHCLTKVYQTSGVRGLFAGVGPRTARTAGGYAVVTSLFEVLKEHLRNTA
mmetsp:Transcript_19365/g.58527  ORF Transcript_19365/g.58527 Transcript_19365/m.58527 type:complete len:382 (-) Transcript_19365:686-1831(-)|eukprot:CAMPEP_0206138254 /NCGR_PEP_ID=MMETSP1473-20131121/3181_1 /ASSEMBLY_ACC=CAM_ASM_001109 /TAXON_ID=1461547 /ORGANISM="Stichococcus sp, Strain RCC1054" /LENGTH=381 /DNA_ID=CAMNT_0053531621 /DNA_START=357 /DNA_END=1502 /DNA_ORIENTATION=+